MKFYPYEKRGGAEKVLAMLKLVGGGGTTSFGVVLPCLEGGGRKKFRTRDLTML